MQNSKYFTAKARFIPVYLNNVGLSDHSIRHLQHLNQIPPSVPKQGVHYFQAKQYLA